MKSPKVLHLFSGAGGGGLGFKRAGFESVGAFDSDPAACRDFEYLVGSPATVADLAKISIHDFRNSCTGRPDVVFTSPPCKSFSSCLPAKIAATQKYQEMSALTLRGIMLSLEAWKYPPYLIVMENVPRITTRGKKWLDRIVRMLHSYGYAVRMTDHDCGEIGGLAQHRQRFLLVARLIDVVPVFLRQPPKKLVLPIGEVLSQLPVPLPNEFPCGPIHKLPKLSPLNWVRLALIPAGKDWRALPDQVAVGTPGKTHFGKYGVEDWEGPSHTVIGESRVGKGWAGISDPRVDCVRREGGHGVTSWDDPSTAIIGKGTIHNGPWQIGDPRLTCTPRRGTLRVEEWAKPSHVVIGGSRAFKGQSIADPRVPTIVGGPIDLDPKARPTHLIIRAADGTWHRPMTTLELAALQGFPMKVNGDWLKFDGRSHEAWRQRIGNAVPPPAAEAIALTCKRTLEATSLGLDGISKEPIWVRKPSGGEEWKRFLHSIA